MKFGSLLKIYQRRLTVMIETIKEKEFIYTLNRL